MPEQDARELAMHEAVVKAGYDERDMRMERRALQEGFVAGWNARSEENAELKRKVAELEYDIDRLLRVDMEGREEPKK